MRLPCPSSLSRRFALVSATAIGYDSNSIAGRGNAFSPGACRLGCAVRYAGFFGEGLCWGPEACVFPS